jgi:hypothetical protein
VGQRVAVEVVNVPTEHGFEQSSAEALSVAYCRGVDPAAAAWPAHLEDEVLDF